MRSTDTYEWGRVTTWATLVLTRHPSCCSMGHESGRVWSFPRGILSGYRSTATVAGKAGVCCRPTCTSYFGRWKSMEWVGPTNCGEWAPSSSNMAPRVSAAPFIVVCVLCIQREQRATNGNASPSWHQTAAFVARACRKSPSISTVHPFLPPTSNVSDLKE